MRKSKLIIMLTFFIVSTFYNNVSAQYDKILNLQDICRLTLEKNPIIAGSAAIVEQSNANYKKANASMLPNITLKSSYTNISDPTFFGSTAIMKEDTIIHKVEVVQPIYTGGRLQNIAKASKYASKAAEGADLAVKNKVLTNSATAYFKALQAKEFITVAQSSVKYLEANYEASKKLFESGVVTKADVLRIEVALTSAKERLITSNNNYNTALAALKTAIGLPQSEEIKITSEIEYSSFMNAEELQPSIRPEVESAQSAEKAASLHLRAAKNAYLPNIGVFVDYENQPKGSEFPRLSDTLMAGVQIKLNIFDGGLTQAEIDAAKASLAKAKADLMSANQAVEYQLTEARLALESAKARLKTLETQVSSAEESFRVIEIGYKEGINVITDVLSVEAMLAEAKAAKIAAEYDYKIAQINLLYALGQTQKLLN